MPNYKIFLKFFLTGKSNMVKILWCSSYSPQANMLLDNMAPTCQAATQKPQAKCKLRGLDRLVLRISKPQEICVLLLETPHNNLSQKSTKNNSCSGEKSLENIFRSIGWGYRANVWRVTWLNKEQNFTRYHFKVKSIYRKVKLPSISRYCLYSKG